MSINQIPSGWTITRSDERIVVQHVSGSFYAAAPEGDSGIAESILYMLADSLLSATLSPAHIEDGEEVEVVEFDWPTYLSISNGWPEEVASLVEHLPSEPLMTVAQHQRIVAGLQSEIAKLGLELKDSDEYGEREELRANRYSSELVELRAALSAPPVAQDYFPRELLISAVMNADEVIAALSAPPAAEDGMCNSENPSNRCECREEFGHRVCAAPPAAGVPEGITIERDMMGTMHVKVGEFDYVQVRYQHPYTDNASTRQLAERIAALIASPTPPASEQQQTVLQPHTVEFVGKTCQRVLMAEGKPYPRTCAVCGLSGPCKSFPRENDQRLNPHLAKGEGV